MGVLSILFWSGKFDNAQNFNTLRTINVNIKMMNLKYLLIFSFCVVFSPEVSSVSLKVENKDNEVINIDENTSVNLNHSVKFQDKSLKRVDYGCSCGIYSVFCYSDKQRKYCVCKPGYQQTSPTFFGVCEKCDCGKYSISCTFDYGTKNCNCLSGFESINGTCRTTKCDCGQNSISCKILSDGTKKCTCLPGYAVAVNKITSEEECKKCDCGQNSVSCKILSDGTKKCTCQAGYAAAVNKITFNEECKKCYCGVDKIYCYFDSSGLRRCDCDGFIADYDTGGEKCRSCNCGPFSTKCRIRYGGKRCTCIDGYYAVISSTWGIDEECVKNERKTTPYTSGWRAGSYTAVIIHALVITTLLIIMKYQRKHRR